MKIVYLLLLLFGITCLRIHAQTCGFDEKIATLSEKDPDIYRRFQELFKNNDFSDYRQKIVIPIVIHILWNDENQNISDDAVMEQIKILNRDFNNQGDLTIIPKAFRPFIATKGIRFCLPNFDPKGMPSNGIERKSTEIKIFQGATENALYSTSKGGLDAWDEKRFLNIWVANINPDLLGQATFPGETHVFDGVVIHYDAFGIVESMNSFGRTLVHEIGHYFGLPHIWGMEEGCDFDDGIEDTPNQEKYHFFCPKHPSISCGSPDMFMNFMDYVDDECMVFFTKGQMDHMIKVIYNQRSGLLDFSCKKTVKVDDNENYLSPNPTHDLLSVHSKLIGKIQIFNSLGQLVMNKYKPVGQDTNLDISRLQSGIYFMWLDGWGSGFLVE